MEIKPIKKVTLTEQIMQQIASQIISGQLKPGEKLPTERPAAQWSRCQKSSLSA